MEVLGGTVKTESALDLLRRVTNRPTRVGEQACILTKLQTGDVMEVVGSSGAGKTEMLYHIALNSVLPETYDGMVFGGSDRGVCFVDLDYRFSIVRLNVLFESLVSDIAMRNGRDLGMYMTSPACKSLRTKVFDRILIVTCQTSEELLALMMTLSASTGVSKDTKNASVPASVSSSSSSSSRLVSVGSCNPLKTPQLLHKESISMLLLDNFFAFHWSQKAFGKEQLYDQLSVHVRKLRAGGFSVVASRLLITKIELEASLSMQIRDYPCRAWSNLLTHKVLLSQDNTPSHNAAMRQDTIKYSGRMAMPSQTGQRASTEVSFSYLITGKGLQFGDTKK
eukprot:gb/GEZN01012070.1/.p1 GENE.gb/GEZN01012070.1/~~gb/GEZN01012070.1/.p1  ORF type:complete len:337 (-),score=45.07 gb/GEZN01012070.1/:49-1059(-)